MTDEQYMEEAYKQAKKAYLKDEVPIGAVIVYQDKIIARGYNKRVLHQNTEDHAEMVAIRKANKVLGSWRLEDCDIYVTLEPCPMCAGAIQQARMRRVIYGASDLKAGAVGTKFNLYDIKGYNHYPKVTKGVLEEKCSEILTDFFKKLRAKRQK